MELLKSFLAKLNLPLRMEQNLGPMKVCIVNFGAKPRMKLSSRSLSVPIALVHEWPFLGVVGLLTTNTSPNRISDFSSTFELLVQTSVPLFSFDV